MRKPDAQAESQEIPARPMLQGERIWLRPLEERDMPAYAAGINDTAVGIPAGYRWPMSADHARAWLERQQDSVKRGDAFLYAVCEVGDDQFIGTAWLHEVSWLDGSAELAIYMDHEHLGAGWGTDAVRTIVRFGFVSLGLTRIWLTVDAVNARAIRSYEKVGFRTEGVMRQSRRGLNGLADSLMMALLRDEWEALKGSG
jgi:RimJ/RimL family protein N-acetyltransferase